MNAQATLAQLRRNFLYLADGALDTWSVATGRARVAGDCEDFALALAWRLAGGSWWRFLWHLASFKSVIWYARTRAGVGHAVLWHRGAGWTDNIYPTWAPRTPHRRRFPWPLPLVLVKLALSPLFAWINRTVKRAKSKD